MSARDACVLGVMWACLVPLLWLVGCVNPNANNPDKYDACDFIEHLDLTVWGIHDCETWKEHYGKRA